MPYGISVASGDATPDWTLYWYRDAHDCPTDPWLTLLGDWLEPVRKEDEVFKLRLKRSTFVALQIYAPNDQLDYAAFLLDNLRTTFSLWGDFYTQMGMTPRREGLS